MGAIIVLLVAIGRLERRAEHSGSLPSGSIMVPVQVDLDRRDRHGCTLLHHLCSMRHLPGLAALLGANADASVADASGMSPLDWAAAANDSQARGFGRVSSA